METCLSIGSNLGDRLANLRKAKDLISSISGTIPFDHSSVYETEPVGTAPEHNCLLYLNAVILIRSSLPVRELFARLCEIEKSIGRDRSKEAERNSPRVIDIDIIYSGSLVIDSPDLVIPHPRWSKRRFVVQPLAEILPEKRVPGSDRTVSEILLALPPSPKVISYKEAW